MLKPAKTRQLIKFSHYSTCLILPKDMLEELGWKQGDQVAVGLDRHHSQLTVTKTGQADSRSSTTPVSGRPVNQRLSTNESHQGDHSPADRDEILPIPELGE